LARRHLLAEANVDSRYSARRRPRTARRIFIWGLVDIVRV